MRCSREIWASTPRTAKKRMAKVAFSLRTAIQKGEKMMIDQSMECFFMFVSWSFHGFSHHVICIMFGEIWDFKSCLLQVMRQRFATQPFGMFPSSTSYWSSYGSSYWGSPIWIDGWNLGMVDPTALLTLACWCLLCQVAAPVTGPPKLTFPIPGSMEGVKPLPENPTPRTSQVHGV